MSRILSLTIIFLSVNIYPQALPPTRSGEQGGALSTQFNWIYKSGFLTSLGSITKMVDSDSQRVLTNQNFEDATVSNGWTYTPSGADVVTEETTDVIDGFKAAKITPAAETFTFEQTVSLDKYNTTAVSFKIWVKADFSSEVCFMQGAVEGACLIYSGSNEWEEITVSGVVTTGTPVGVRYKSDSAVTGTALIDFVRFIANPDSIAAGEIDTCVVQEVAATSGTSLSNNNYVTNVLTSTVGNCSFLSLSTNTISLSAGKYLVKIRTSLKSNGSIGIVCNAIGRLRNTTDGATAFNSNSIQLRSSGGGAGFINTIPLLGENYIDIATSKDYELQTYINDNGGCGFVLGGDTLAGENPQISSVQFIKVGI